MPACSSMIAGRTGGEKGVLLGVSWFWRGSPVWGGARPGIGGVLPLRGPFAGEPRRFPDIVRDRVENVAKTGAHRPPQRRRSQIMGRAFCFGGEGRRFLDAGASPPVAKRGFCAARQIVLPREAFFGATAGFWDKGFMWLPRGACKSAFFSPCEACFAGFPLVLGNKFYATEAATSNLLPKTQG